MTRARRSLLYTGASTLAKFNTSSGTLSPLILSYRQLVGHLNWNDRQNGVTAKEACAFTEPSSPVVFPTDRPAAIGVAWRRSNTGAFSNAGHNHGDGSNAALQGVGQVNKTSESGHCCNLFNDAPEH